MKKVYCDKCGELIPQSKPTLISTSVDTCVVTGGYVHGDLADLCEKHKIEYLELEEKLKYEYRQAIMNWLNNKF